MSKDMYVGMDVHDATTTVHVQDGRGREVMTTTVPTTARSLVTVIKAIPGRVRLTFEEGIHATWLYDLMRPHVAELVVCDPRKNRLVVDGNKSDVVDARKLAGLLRGGFLKAVYHGENGTRNLKQLAHGYIDLVRDTVRAKNQAKSIFRSQGIPVAGRDVYQREQREEWLEKLPSAGLKRRASWVLSQVDVFEGLREEARKAMVEEAKKQPGYRVVCTVPGIKDIRAAEIIAVVDTPFRFRTKRQYWSYVGLSVVTRSSSDYEVTEEGVRRKQRVTTRGLTRVYNRTLKHVYKGAAVDAMTHGALRKYGAELIEGGMRPEMARLTVARKLAAVSLAIWKKGERYDGKKLMRKE